MHVAHLDNVMQEYSAICIENEVILKASYIIFANIYFFCGDAYLYLAMLLGFIIRVGMAMPKG